MTSHKESGDNLTTDIYFFKIKCFLAFHVQILLQNVVWSGKYSNVNADYSNIHSDCSIHISGALSNITERTVRKAS